MATKRARRAEREPEEIAENVAEAESPSLTDLDGEEAESEMADLGVQLPEGAAYSLWRLVDGGDKEFVEEGPVAGFTIASVASRFGGGRYMMYLKKPHPDIAGRWFKAGSKKFRVLGPPRYNVVDAGSPTPALAGAAETEKLQRAYGDLIQQSIRQSAESQQLMQGMQLALLKSMTERPATAPDTSLELLKTILPALIAGRQNGPSIADVIALADKMTNRNSPTAQLKETLDLVATARELGGGDASTPAWMPMAAKALEVIAGAVRYDPNRKPVEGEVVEDTPAPVAALPPANVPANMEAALHPLLKFLAPQIPGLVQHAQNDHDPDTYAGVLVDSIPEEHYPDVVAFLTSPDFAQQLHRAFPATQSLQQWFEELRSNIVDRIQELQKPDNAGADLLEPPT